MASLPILTSINSWSDFEKILQSNPGMIIIKMGASWCAPCQTIEPTVKEYFSKMPANVQCYSLDVDDNFEIFGQFKKKKLVKGIPALYAYYPENEDNYPDDFVSSGNVVQVEMFFNRCLENVNK